MFAAVVEADRHARRPKLRVDGVERIARDDLDAVCESEDGVAERSAAFHVVEHGAVEGRGGDLEALARRGGQTFAGARGAFDHPGVVARYFDAHVRDACRVEAFALGEREIRGRARVGLARRAERLLRQRRHLAVSDRLRGEFRVERVRQRDGVVDAQTGGCRIGRIDAGRNAAAEEIPARREVRRAADARETAQRRDAQRVGERLGVEAEQHARDGRGGDGGDGERRPDALAQDAGAADGRAETDRGCIPRRHARAQRRSVDRRARGNRERCRDHDRACGDAGREVDVVDLGMPDRCGECRGVTRRDRTHAGRARRAPSVAGLPAGQRRRDRVGQAPGCDLRRDGGGVDRGEPLRERFDRAQRSTNSRAGSRRRASRKRAVAARSSSPFAPSTTP